MNKKLITLIFTISFLFFSKNVFSQTETIKGIVIDSLTKKPLPFVNIIYNNQKQGLSANIDGSFQIKRSNKIKFLEFSYLGYKTKHLNIKELKSNKILKIKLSEKIFDINEITVFAGENPAHRIINKVIENRKINNPENLESFSYKSYDKMVFTVDLDKALKEVKNENINIDSLMRDSSYLNAKNMVDSLFFFMTETLSERKFKKPGKIAEKVIATRVSGLKNTSFFVLATSFQSFSFYNEMITLAESRYINPISKGSTKRYFFNIEDTTYNQRGDTIFRISYKPKKGKNFEALEGVLNINTHKYAIENVIAKPVDNNGLVNIEIQQKYELLNNKFWFPTELNTTMIFPASQIEAGSLKMDLLSISKSYIYDIEINTEISKKDFSIAQLEIAKDALKKDSLFWDKNRKYKLTEKENTTYHVIDSIGKKHNLDLTFNSIQALTKGYIPIQFLDLNLSDLMNYNEFEQLRLGLGMKTNDKISSIFSIGGYFGYGFGDKEFKYGGNLLLNIYKKRDLKLNFSYKNDLIESSGYSFLERQNLSSTEIYRQYLVQDMTYVEEYSSSIQLMPFKHFNLQLNFAVQEIQPSIYSDFIPYNFTETSLQFRFAPNEDLAYIDNEFIPLLSTSSPIFLGNVVKGFNTLGGNYDYLKLETKLQISFLTKAFGKTNLQITGGKIWGKTPYFKQYNGHGNYSNFQTETANSFATMRMNEFLSDEFLAVYFRQDFGSLLFKTEKFKPQILLISSLAYGKLNKPDLKYNLPYKTMEKGYFESGILINSIIRPLKFMGLGFGAFYRYGNYAFANEKDNFAYKFSITFEL